MKIKNIQFKPELTFLEYLTFFIIIFISYIILGFLAELIFKQE